MHLKISTPVNLHGKNWFYIGKAQGGMLLRSTDKHIANRIVSWQDLGLVYPGHK